MHRLVVGAVLAGFLVAVSPGSAASAGPVSSDPADLVQPFVGTENYGNTFPGASAPFGMVQVSPDTGGQGGYDYKQSTLYGFSQTHLSGVGCGVAGELPIMPTTGAVTSVDPGVYRSAYAHDDEQASPGYYRVGLSTYGIGAELTATERTGWQRYTFPAGSAANVLFNTGKANQSVIDSEIHVVGDRTVEGRVHDGGFCAGHDDHTVYFSASFDRPFSSYGTWRGSTIGSGRDASGTGGNGAFVTFGSADAQTVVLKVGLSYTSADGARANLAAETGDSYDFDQVRAAARSVWTSTLDKIKISGGTTERREVFYTALYHSLLHPNLAGDVDGSYMGFDRAVHRASGYTPYQNFSLWDTYRPQNQLLELLEPSVARDVALSLVSIGRDGGWLPRWALAGSETNIMTGDPVTPFLVEAWSKGLLAGHEDEAYALLRANALSQPPADSPYNGRTGVGYYSDRGYIPSGLVLGTDCVAKGGDNDCQHPASATMEYSAADAALALMAAGLGKKDDARLFSARGQWWRNLWDSSTRQFRPRTTDGTWLTPYDPVAADEQFHEGGAYQYQWLVPQDPAGLVSQMGGREAAAARLDSFFAYPDLLSDPSGTARNEWIASPYDYYAKATYNPNNEPDLLSPYLYHWVGRPAKTATVVRAAMTLFTTGPDGMTGNDDLGTMSAWYVFSSLGLYPTMSGSNFLALSSPQFPSAVVSVGGKSLTISAPGVSDDSRYVQRARVNGRDTTRSWIPWSAIGAGGSISQVVGAAPSSWGTRVADEPPSVNRAPLDGRSRVDASLRPGSAALPASSSAASSSDASSSGAVVSPSLSGPAVVSGPSRISPETSLPERSTLIVARKAAAGLTAGTSATFTVDIVAQSPTAITPRVRAVVPDGWKATVKQPGTLVSHHLPVSGTATVTVAAPTGVAPGTYPLTVTVSGPNQVSRTASLILKDALTCASSSSAGSCAVDLTPERTADGTATTTASDQGNFDGGGWSYDAGLLPAAGPVTWGGVTYQAPDPTGTALNFVAATGQPLLVPPADHAAVDLIAASYNGPVTAAVTVTYTDGTFEERTVTVSDWCASAPAAGSTVALAMDHRIKAGQGVDTPPTNLYALSLPIPSGKQVQSLTLPNDPRLMLYALTLA